MPHSQDRAAPLEIMTALGITVRGYKTAAAWTGEKAARLKLNSRIRSRSPLSDPEEREMLWLGVGGKRPAGARCDGMLTVTVPKAETDKPRRIEITGS